MSASTIPNRDSLTRSAPSPSRSIPWSGWLLLPLFILATSAAALTGLLFPPDAWYADLAKPSWTPPGAVFGPVWLTLYVLMGISLWLIHVCDATAAQRRSAMAIFALQWLFNVAWTPVFFGLHLPGPAFGVLCLLWLMLVWTLIGFHRLRPLAAALLVPYWLWVSFALVLNGVIWLMN
ncbi:MAG: tryptophan-rich sensory protein [Xanthomonadales bacterium]|nr:tryptophan-rich sensory protein [Xanthomonadales bacterium]